MGSLSTLDTAQAADLASRYRAEWHAVASSTGLADRPRAEAAIHSLYRGSGRPEPRVLWVASPAAGMLAAGLAAETADWVRGEHTLGDIGSGSRRDWHALARPFEIALPWRRTLAKRIEERVQRWGLAGHGSSDPRRAFGFVGRESLVGNIASVAAGRVHSLTPTGEVSSPAAVAAERLGDDLLGPFWEATVGATGLELARDLFARSVRRTADQLVSKARSSRDVTQAMQPGQFDIETPLQAAIRDCFGDPLWSGSDPAARIAPIDARLEIARSAGPWWAFEGLAILSERPLVAHFDDRGRAHAEHGPALAWPDGLELWAWHGVRVPSWMVTDPDQITVERIDEEANAEVKRVLVERFGSDRLIRLGGAELVAEDETGRLWRRRLGPEPRWGWDRVDEPIVMVEVLNSTPEPDGSRKTYFLRVPPRMESAREAVAWTFGLDGGAYRPAIET